MRFIAPRHIDDTQITVTNTATALFSLMGTAASVSPSTISDYYIPNGNAVWLYCATNSFRFAFGTPTANKGGLVQAGERRLVLGDLSTLKLIRAGGSDATVDLEIGKASEFDSVFGMSNTASVTVTADTEFSAASAASDAYVNPTSTTDVKSLSHSFNGTTWDRTRSAVITPSATLTGIQNSLPWAMYNASPTVRTEGQGGPLQATTLGSLIVAGSNADAATATGNPVPAGAIYETTPPTYTNAQRSSLHTGTRGALHIQILDANGTTGVGVSGSVVDGLSNSTNGLNAFVRPSRYNGSTWDREYNNTDLTILASAARTTTQTSADLVNYNSKGIKVVLDMTTVGTGSVTLAINGKDSVSGKYYAILTGAAVITNSTNVYTVYPGITTALNAAVSDILPRTYQIVVTANNANSATYSVGASLIG